MNYVIGSPALIPASHLQQLIKPLTRQLHSLFQFVMITVIASVIVHPQTTALTTASSSRNLPVGQNPTSTVGLPSNSGTGASTIGPSPFERSHSTMLGLRASLPKLPSFKVKRQPEQPKTDKLDSVTRKRSNIESSDVLERETKRRILDEGDSEMETDLESSSGWDRRPRTVSRLDEGERSQSPLQLDDSIDAAPRATIVRSTEGKIGKMKT